MQPIYKKILFIFTLSCLISVANAQDAAMTVTQYIAKFKNIAIEEMKLTGIPASITLAQGILESANGSSYLARYAHNHFGIKCKGDWTGKTVKYNDDAPDECFRAYDNAEDSYRDHANYLKNTKRYAFLFQLKRTDYKGWANGLKTGGYASNPSYPQLIINTIESMNLAQYDSMPSGNAQQDSLTATYGKRIIYNKIHAYRTKDGQTYREIAIKNRLMGWQLYRDNDFHSRYLDADIPAQPIPGTILYLRPKKRKGTEPFHVMQPGESMYSVSQDYGIKLKQLYQKNLLEQGERMHDGDTVYLQAKRKEPPLALVKSGAVKPAPKHTKPQAHATLVADEGGNKPENHDSIVVVPEKKVVDTFPNEGYWTVQQGETLHTIAIKLHTTDNELKIDNHLATDSVHAGQRLKTPNTIIAPAPTIAVQTPVPASAPKPETVKTVAPPVAETFHIVQKGETYSSIALKYHLSVAKLKAINHKTNDVLPFGQKLYLTPNITKPSNNSPTNAQLPKPQEKTAAQAPVSSSKKTMSDHNTATEPETYHIVQKGETYSSLSLKYHLSVDKLKAINHRTNDVLPLGQKIYFIDNTNTANNITDKGQQIKPKEKIAPPSAKPITSDVNVNIQNETYHIVQKGETLTSIALKYHLSLTTIKAINNKTDDKISAGEKLNIRADNVKGGNGAEPLKNSLPSTQIP